MVLFLLTYDEGITPLFVVFLLIFIFLQFHGILHIRFNLLQFLLKDHPIKNIVIFIAQLVEEVFEELAKVTVVGSLFELKVPAVLHVGAELVGKAVAELLHRALDLLLLYSFIFFFFIVSL